MSDLSELKARVDAATGPDRELDALIWLGVGLDAVMAGSSACYDSGEVIYQFNSGDSLSGTAIRYPSHLSSAAISFGVPRTTGSIDAALALVERVLPGAKVIVERGYTGDGRASLLPSRDGFPQFHTVADTPPLAILSAMLAALSSAEQTADPDPGMTP